MTGQQLRRRSIGQRLVAGVFTLITFVCAESLLAQTAFAQSGTVSGRVTDAASGLAIRSAQISITGTSLGAMTDADGRYRIASVPATARELTVKRIGYRPATVAFALDASGGATVNTALTESATTLEAIVTTGAVGDTRKRATRSRR
jgi:hypothetical protein